MSDQLRHRLSDAGAHAMRQRSALAGQRKSVSLELLPVGIEVCVRSYGRERKVLLGWHSIEEAKFNPIVERIDYLLSVIDKK